MKILVIVPSLSEKGPNIVAKNIADFSENNNIEYIFLSLRKNSKQDIERYSQYKVYELNMGNIPTINFIHKFRRKISEINPTHVHAHTFWPTIIVPFLNKKYKRLVTIHNNPKEDYSFEYGKIVGGIMTYLFYFSLLFYNEVIAISNYVKNSIKVINPRDIKVIYNGIEDRFEENEVNKNNEINIVAISVLNKLKNIRMILDVFNEIKESHPNIKCTIIGDGPEKNNLIKYAADNKLENVKFVGLISRKEVFNYLRHAEALIHTSQSEGFGLVVAEAFMMSKPVIVSNIEVMKEIVDDKKNGFLCNNIDEYINAILYLNNYDIKINMNKNARKKYLKEFTLSNNIIKYEELYS